MEKNSGESNAKDRRSTWMGRGLGEERANINGGGVQENVG